jgi:hypothetical protein
MRHPEGPRVQRRLRARRLKQQIDAEIAARKAEQPKEPVNPQGDPRVGDDKRRQERRSRSMSPHEVEDWLNRNGISGGNRRMGQRRQGYRRR